jgi:hypothetical protein
MLVEFFFNELKLYAAIPIKDIPWISIPASIEIDGKATFFESSEIPRIRVMK